MEVKVNERKLGWNKEETIKNDPFRQKMKVKWTEMNEA